MNEEDYNEYDSEEEKEYNDLDEESVGYDELQNLKDELAKISLNTGKKTIKTSLKLNKRKMRVMLTM